MLTLHWMSLQEGHLWHQAIPMVLKFFGEILALHQMSLQEGHLQHHALPMALKSLGEKLPLHQMSLLEGHLQHCMLNNGNYIILGNARPALDAPPGGTSVASCINKWLSNSLVKNPHCTRCPSRRDIRSIAC